MRSLGLSAFCLALACRQAPAQWAPQPPDAVDVPLQLCVTSSFSGTHSAPLSLSCQTPKPRGGVISKPTSKIQTWGPRLRFCTEGHRQGYPEHTSRVAYRPLILLVSVEATLRVRAPTPRGRPWSHSCSKRASPEIPALAGARQRRLCSQTGRARAEAALQLHPGSRGRLLLTVGQPSTTVYRPDRRPGSCWDQHHCCIWTGTSGESRLSNRSRHKPAAGEGLLPEGLSLAQRCSWCGSRGSRLRDAPRHQGRLLVNPSSAPGTGVPPRSHAQLLTTGHTSPCDEDIRKGRRVTT